MSGWSPIGDIHERELLAFSFIATTDNDATDGFPWVLHGDQGNDIEGMGYWFDDDDGPSDEDDDTPVPDDDDDREEEDDSGGCRC